MTGTHTGSRTGGGIGATTTGGSDSVKDKAASAVGSATESVKETGSELTSKAGERAGDVAHRVADKADERKDELARTARTLQEKAREFATSITEEQPQVGHALEQVTSSADRVISYVEQTPVQEMTQDVTRHMRRHPMLFAAGMFGIGFALTRILKPVDRNLELESGATRQLPVASSVDGGMH